MSSGFVPRACFLQVSPTPRILTSWCQLEGQPNSDWWNIILACKVAGWWREGTVHSLNLWIKFHKLFSSDTSGCLSNESLYMKECSSRKQCRERGKEEEEGDAGGRRRGRYQVKLLYLDPRPSKVSTYAVWPEPCFHMIGRELVGD